MLKVPPEILKVAREFLGLSQEQVEQHSGISRATIQRIERSVRELPQYALLVQHFYEECGIEFVAPAEQKGWGVFNSNMRGRNPQLNRLKASSVAGSERKGSSANLDQARLDSDKLDPEISEG